MHNMNVFYTYIYNVQRTEYIILKHITYIIIEIHKESGQHMWVMLSVAIRDYYVHKAAEYENVTTVSGAPELRWMWREDNSHENDRVKGTKKKNICPVWWSHVDDVRACVCMWFDVMLFFLLFFAYFWCRSRYGTQLLGAKNVSATVPSCVVWQDAWMLWVVFFSLCLNTRNIHISTVHLRFHGCSLKIDELCVMFRTYYMCDRHPIYIYVDWMKLKTFRNEWARCINLCQLGLACR